MQSINYTVQNVYSNTFIFFKQFLGECVVDNAKGTDIVKDAIRKRKVRMCNICYSVLSLKIEVEERTKKSRRGI